MSLVVVVFSFLCVCVFFRYFIFVSSFSSFLIFGRQRFRFPFFCRTPLCRTPSPSSPGSHVPRPPEFRAFVFPLPTLFFSSPTVGLSGHFVKPRPLQAGGWGFARCPENPKIVCCEDIFNEKIAQRPPQFLERPRKIEKENKERVREKKKKARKF